MKQFDCRLLLGLGSLVAAGTAGLLAPHSRKSAPTDAECHGRYSPMQILRLAEQMAGRVEPMRRMEVFEAEYYTFWDRTVGSRSLWHVQCRDGSGGQVCLKWEAGSGRLLWASRSSPRPCSGEQRVTQREAARVASAWLHDLTMADAGSVWTARTAPVRSRGTWTVHLVEAKRHATVVLDASDGSLQYAAQWD